MYDFPPLVHAYSADRGTEDGPREREELFAHPDLRGPKRFLLWLLRQQWPLLAVTCLVSVVEWLPGSVGPYVVGRVIDTGVRAGDTATTVRLLLNCSRSGTVTSSINGPCLILLCNTIECHQFIWHQKPVNGNLQAQRVLYNALFTTQRA